MPDVDPNQSGNMPPLAIPRMCIEVDPGRSSAVHGERSVQSQEASDSVPQDIVLIRLTDLWTVKDRGPGGHVHSSANVGEGPLRERCKPLVAYGLGPPCPGSPEASSPAAIPSRCSCGLKGTIMAQSKRNPPQALHEHERQATPDLLRSVNRTDEFIQQQQTYVP